MITKHVIKTVITLSLIKVLLPIVQKHSAAVKLPMNSSLNGHTQQHKLHFNAFCIIIWINNSTWGVILYKQQAGSRAASTGFSLSKSNSFHWVFIKLGEYVDRHNISTKFYNQPNPSRHSWIMALDLSKIKVDILGFWSSLFNEIRYMYLQYIYDIVTYESCLMWNWCSTEHF